MIDIDNPSKDNRMRAAAEIYRNIEKMVRAETLAEVEKMIEALPKRALLGWDGTQIYYIECDDILSAIQELKEGERG